MSTTPPQTTTFVPLTIHTDGGSRGNPGPAATGIVVYDQSHQQIHSFGTYIGIATNNVAEYSAVLHALEWVIKTYPQTPPHLSFKLDSKLVVEQLSGRWQVKDLNLQTFKSKILALSSQAHLNITYTYVPRSQNAAADHQVNLALDQALNN